MKYIIDIPDEVPVSDELVPFDMCRPSWFLEAYKKGKAEAEDEVWEFAWEVLQLDLPVFREIFGYDTDKMDYRDYKYKYEAWKKQKDEVVKQKVFDLAEEIGIHRLYAIVREIRGE